VELREETPLETQIAGPVIVAAYLSGVFLLERDRLQALARRVSNSLSNLSTRLIFLPQNWAHTRSERGQSMVEYGLVMAVVSMVAIVTLKNVGANLRSVFTAVWAKLHS